MTDPTTPKLVSNGLCWSDGTDILCDGTAGLASGGGTVADKIISSTTKVTANQTGYISFTTAGTTTGYMDTAGIFILPGISTTGTVSSTIGYYSGNVGIGMAPNAGWGLDVSGSLQALGNGTFSDLQISNNQPLGWSGTVSNIKGSSFNSGYLAFTTSSTEAMRIVSTGFVGINTTAPATRLQVNGTLRSTAADFPNTGIGVELRYYGGAGQLFALDRGTSTNKDLQIGTSSGSGSQLLLKASGNVGINNVITPTAPLEVSGTISATIISGTHYGDGSHLTGVIASSNGDNITSGTTKVTANQTGYVSFTTGGTTTGYMDTAGKFIVPGIGIGTSTPASLLHLYSTTGGANNVLLGPMGLSGLGAIGFGSSLSNASYSIAGDGNRTLINAANGSYIDMRVSNSSIMYLSSAGIGIGTSTPAVALDIQRTALTSASEIPLINALESSTSAGIRIGYYTNTAGTGVQEGRLRSTNGVPLALGTITNPQALYILNNGNVGIGTTTPSGTLHVFSTANTSVTFSANDGSGAGTRIMFDVQANTNNRTMTIGGSSIQVSKTNFLAGAQPLLLNPNGGNLSVNTFSNQAALHVSGSAFITSWTAINTNVTATAPLEVSGTISATIISGTHYGDGSHLTGVIASSNGDNIASGTTKVTVNTTGYVSFTTGGTTTGYMNTAGVFVLPGVSTTGRLSATSLNPEIIPIGDLTDVSTSSANGVIFIGSTNGATALITDTTAVGSNTLASASNSGYANSAFGAWALSVNTTGYEGTAVGRGALKVNSSGYQNTAVGRNALTANTTGYQNTALGRSAMFTNVSGANNTAVGGTALGNANPVTNTVAIGFAAGLGVNGSTAFANGVFVGTGSGQSITTGNNNTFLGTYSGNNTTSGFTNIYLGYVAGEYMTTGSNNILIGYDASASTAATSYGLNIGNSIYGDMTNAASTIGGAAKIGINYVTPTNALEVSGTISATALAVRGSGQFGSVGSGLMAATGISITTNQTSVTTLYASGAVQFAAYGAGTLTTDASGNITASSDERLKSIKGGFTRGPAAIEALNPIVYRWNAKSGNETSGTYAGFSAQNVQSAIPEAVSTDKRGYLTLSDRPIEAAMVNAIKELKAANDNLKAANDRLMHRLDDQQRDIDTLKQRAGIR